MAFDNEVLGEAIVLQQVYLVVNETNKKITKSVGIGYWMTHRLIGKLECFICRRRM